MVLQGICRDESNSLASYNDFPVTQRVSGRELSCPCCGFLKLHNNIENGLRVLEALVGFQLINGCFCVQEAKRYYKRENPSCRRNRFRSVPMFGGNGICVKLDPAPNGWRPEIRKAMEKCGLEMWTDGADLTYLAVAE